MSLAVQAELTTESPWAKNWVEYYAVFTNTGTEHHEPFEGQHQLFGPDGSEVSRGGLGRCEGLAPGQQFTTERFNLMPLDAGGVSQKRCNWFCSFCVSESRLLRCFDSMHA